MYLIELFLEAHDAMIYYYKSINDLLQSESLYAEIIDERFKKIQDKIKDEIICRYRNILYVYSKPWTSVHKIDPIKFTKLNLSPSFNHDVHSVVIARYLREWVQQMNNVISILDRKLI